jgi:hypothetical protein
MAKKIRSIMRKLIIIAIILLIAGNVYAFRDEDDNDFIPGLKGFGTGTLGPYAGLVSHTGSCTFEDDNTPDTITAETDLEVIGFAIGDTIEVSGSSNGNDGYYLITDINGAVIEVYPAASLTDETGSVTIQEWPTVCIVESLLVDADPPANDTRSGYPVKDDATLEGCTETFAHSNTIVMFEKSGVIYENAGGGDDNVYRLDLDDNAYYIAGQTAPSPGITLRNIYPKVRASDFVMEHIKSRVGDAADGFDSSARDSLGIVCDSANISNIIINNNSFTWAIDETASIYDNGAGSIDSVTFSNNIVAEALHESLHPKGAHSKGLLVGVAYGMGESPTNVAVIGNLFAALQDRNPLIQSHSIVVANNYSHILAGETTCIYPQIQPDYDYGTISWFNNFVHSDRYGKFVQLWSPVKGAWKTPTSSHTIYISGNDTDLTAIQASDTDWSEVDNPHSLTVTDFREDLNEGGGETYADASIAITDFTALTADNVMANVLESVGARPGDRDSVDSRIIAYINDGSGGAIIDSPDDVGGYPSKTDSRNLETDMEALGAFPADFHGDDDADGYTNGEEWLRSLADYIIDGPPPPVVSGMTFWWNAEDGDISDDADNVTYSAGDEDTTPFNGSFTADADHGEGTNGLDLPQALAQTCFDSASIIDAAGAATIGFWLRPINKVGSQIFYLRNDSGNGFFAIKTNAANDELDVVWKDSTDTYNLNLESTGGGITDDTWSYVEITFDNPNNLFKLYTGDNDNKTLVLSSTATINDFSETDFCFGDISGVADYDVHIDAIKISDEFDADLYGIRNDYSYSGEPGPTFDTITCTAGTYTCLGDVIECTGTTSEEIFVNDALYFDCGTIRISYISKDGTDIVIQSSTLEHGDETVGLSCDASWTSDGSVKNAQGADATLTLPTITNAESVIVQNIINCQRQAQGITIQ